ncbi:hypothetical protein Pfo_013452 [Paulownia fortunei]|nr:hypothetical protein Pfo_013452 [Paulownia fortunei]
MQWRGTRGGNNYSSYNSDEAVGGRQLNDSQENGASSPMGRASKSSMPVLHKESNKVPAVASSTAPANGSTTLCNGSSSPESTSQLAERNIREMLSEAAGVASEANLHSLHTLEDPSSEQATSENALTFGSLDASLGQNNEDSDPRDSSVPTNTETSKEPSTVPQSSSPISGRGDYPDRSPSPPHGGNSLIPSTTGSTPSMTQPRGIAQSSIAVSPQLFPFLRQPYPPNYIPYSPYFSQLYMAPQNVHQLLSHIHKPGNIAGNLKHLGISSGYGSYGASGLGYGPGAVLPTGTSSNDDTAGCELKEKNMYSTIKQNEDLHVLTSASGRDTSALQANVFYNLPQGQPVAFSPAQVGHNSFPCIYDPPRSMSTPSLVQSLQQSQPTVCNRVDLGAAVEGGGWIGEGMGVCKKCVYLYGSGQHNLVSRVVIVSLTRKPLS